MHSRDHRASHEGELAVRPPMAGWRLCSHTQGGELGPFYRRTSREAVRARSRRLQGRVMGTRRRRCVARYDNDAVGRVMRSARHGPCALARGARGEGWEGGAAWRYHGAQTSKQRRPRRAGPAGPRRRCGRALWSTKGTKQFRLAHFDRVLFKIFQLNFPD
jgi:hypothetical protein